MVPLQLLPVAAPGLPLVIRMLCLPAAELIGNKKEAVESSSFDRQSKPSGQQQEIAISPPAYL